MHYHYHRPLPHNVVHTAISLSDQLQHMYVLKTLNTTARKYPHPPQSVSRLLESRLLRLRPVYVVAGPFNRSKHLLFDPFDWNGVHPHSESFCCYRIAPLLELRNSSPSLPRHQCPRSETPRKLLSVRSKTVTCRCALIFEYSTCPNLQYGESCGMLHTCRGVRIVIGV